MNAVYGMRERWSGKEVDQTGKGITAKYCGNLPVNGSKEVLCGAGPCGGHHVPIFVAVDAGRLSDVQRAGLEHLTW